MRRPGGKTDSRGQDPRGSRLIPSGHFATELMLAPRILRLGAKYKIFSTVTPKDRRREELSVSHIFVEKDHTFRRREWYFPKIFFPKITHSEAANPFTLDSNVYKLTQLTRGRPKKNLAPLKRNSYEYYKVSHLVQTHTQSEMGKCGPKPVLRVRVAFRTRGRRRAGDSTNSVGTFRSGINLGATHPTSLREISDTNCSYPLGF